MINIDLIAPYLAAVLGAFIGSFFNVIAIRTIEGKSWWGKERSLCPHCNHQLSAIDLIPFFSWLFLRGKCRYCRASIGLRYPLSELAFALWGFIALWRWGLTPAGVMATAGGWFMMLNSLTDMYSGYIYDHLALSLGIAGAIIRLYGGASAFMGGVTGAAAGFAIIALIILASRGGMGWGDANLMAGAGAILGWKMVILGSYLGFMAGGIVAIALLLLKKVKRKDAVPLAPFLAAGVLMAMIWGPEILELWSFYPGWPWR